MVILRARNIVLAPLPLVVVVVAVLGGGAAVPDSTCNSDMSLDHGLA